MHILIYSIYRYNDIKPVIYETYLCFVVYESEEEKKNVFPFCVINEKQKLNCVYVYDVQVSFLCGKCHYNKMLLPGRYTSIYLYIHIVWVRNNNYINQWKRKLKKTKQFVNIGDLKIKIKYYN